MDEASQKILDGIPKAEAPLTPFSNYAKTATLRRFGGSLYGEFSSSFTGACAGSIPSSIAEGAIQSIREVAPCPNGQGVTEVISL